MTLRQTLAELRYVAASPPREFGGFDARLVAIAQSACEKLQSLDAHKKALIALMPFVLEDYYPDCATPEFKAAVETAKKLI